MSFREGFRNEREEGRRAEGRVKAKSDAEHREAGRWYNWVTQGEEVTDATQRDA